MHLHSSGVTAIAIAVLFVTRQANLPEAVACRKPAAVTEAEQVGLDKATVAAFKEDNARVQAAADASSIPSSGVRVAKFESTDPNNRDNF
ncbi:unnamed protein product [Sphagnum jensenii]